MSKTINRRVEDWVEPDILGEAMVDNSSPWRGGTSEASDGVVNTPRESEKSGFDSKLLLSLLGNQMADTNPAMGALLNMLNGEKPDMMSFLPLMLTMLNKKDTPKKSFTLDDYTIVK